MGISNEVCRSAHLHNWRNLAGLEWQKWMGMAIVHCCLPLPIRSIIMDIFYLSIAAIILLLVIAAAAFFMIPYDAREEWHREKDKAIEARKRSAAP